MTQAIAEPTHGEPPEGAGAVAVPSLSLNPSRLVGTFLDVSRLREATVVICGVGALGNEVAKNLAMSCLGRIILVDRDVIEDHNLTRSVFFSMGDRREVLSGGRSKVAWVAEQVARIDPDVEVLYFHGDIADLGGELFRGASVAFSCFDAVLPRFVLNARCARAGVPVVDGGLGSHYETCCAGTVQTIDPSTGPCYACRLDPRRRAQAEEMIRGTDRGCLENTRLAEAMGGVPTTVMMAAIVGGLQVLEGMKLICGTGRFAGSKNNTMFFDLGLSDAVRFDLQESAHRADCDYHWQVPKDALHPLPGRADELTLDALYDTVRDRFGPDASIDLPHTIWPDALCSQCLEPMPWSHARTLATTERLLRTHGEVPPSARPTGHETCDRGFPSPISRVERFAGQISCPRPLRDLGFPWGHAYRIHGAGQGPCFVHLPADRAVLVRVSAPVAPPGTGTNSTHPVGERRPEDM